MPRARRAKTHRPGFQETIPTSLTTGTCGRVGGRNDQKLALPAETPAASSVPPDAPASIQMRRRATSAAVSFGFLPGGIAFDVTCSMIRLSPLLPATIAAPLSPPRIKVAAVPRSKPPLRASAPWHLMQWARNIGAMSESKRGGAAGDATTINAVSHTLKPISVIRARTMPLPGCAPRVTTRFNNSPPSQMISSASRTIQRIRRLLDMNTRDGDNSRRRNQHDAGLERRRGVPTLIDFVDVPRNSTLMLVAYVSDERYVALPDVIVEFEGAAGSFDARTRANGTVHIALPSGKYKVTLQKPGFGAKSVCVDIAPGQPPYQFRLLSDGLLGYAWPKWVRAGGMSEFRVHSAEPYYLSLWRYGSEKEHVRDLGWFDEHGPRATMQITPDGDYSQTGVAWNRFGYANPALHQACRTPASGLGSTISCAHAKAREFSFPWIVAPREPIGRVAVLASNITWNAYNSFGGRSNYINPDRLPPLPTVNARLELKRYTDPDAITYETDDYAPLSSERPGADQSYRSGGTDHRPHRGASLVPPRVGRVAAPGLAGARMNSPTITTRKPSFTTARSTSMLTRC